MNILVEYVQNILSTTPECWQPLINTLPLDLLARPPAAGEWSALRLMHTVQAERALMQPFMPGCGPWRPFFRDHEVRVPE